MRAFRAASQECENGEAKGSRASRPSHPQTASLSIPGCVPSPRPYLNAVARVLPKAEIVFDKFHVLQQASAALDHVRRQEFFHAGAVMRAYGRGKRCCSTSSPVSSTRSVGLSEMDNNMWINCDRAGHEQAAGGGNLAHVNGLYDMLSTLRERVSRSAD